MKFKVGDYITPKEGTAHHYTYGKFIGLVSRVEQTIYVWDVIEAGRNAGIVKSGASDIRTTISKADIEFEISELQHSPLYQALL